MARSYESSRRKPLFSLLLKADWYGVSGLQRLFREIKLSVAPGGSESDAGRAIQNLRPGWYGALSNQRLPAPFAADERFNSKCDRDSSSGCANHERHISKLFLCEGQSGCGPLFAQFKAAMCTKVESKDAEAAFAEIMRIVNAMEAKLYALEGVHNRFTFEEQFKWEHPQ